MTRVTKNPVERKSELVDAAEQLFLDKGYERTAVSDIVHRTKVAQGTFYYYFDSKADILEAVVEKNIVALEEDMKSTLARKDMDVLQKLNAMINSIFRHHRGKKELIDCAHRESNMALHHELENMTRDRLLPRLVDVITAGAENGIFDVPYPIETAESLLDTILHRLHHSDWMSDHKRRERIRTALEHIVAKVLGINGSTFRLKL